MAKTQNLPVCCFAFEIETTDQTLDNFSPELAHVETIVKEHFERAKERIKEVYPDIDLTFYEA